MILFLIKHYILIVKIRIAVFVLTVWHAHIYAEFYAKVAISTTDCLSYE